MSKTLTPNRRIYQILRGECGLTHHQVRHLFKHRLGGLMAVRDVLYIEFKEDKELWAEPAMVVAALSIRAHARDAGESILNQCWPARESGGEPVMPYTVATLAASIVNAGQSFTKGETRLMWRRIEVLLSYELAEAERAWDERMLSSYLRVKGLI